MDRTGEERKREGLVIFPLGEKQLNEPSLDVPPDE